MLEERRQLETFAQALLAKLVVPHPCGDSRHEHLRLDAMTADDGNRDPLALLEDRRKQVGRFDRLAARPAGLVERELEHQLRGGRHAQLAAREGRQHLEVLLERLQNLVRVQLEVAHDLGERVPLDLRERQENMFVREERVIPSTGLFDSAVHHSLG